MLQATTIPGAFGIASVIFIVFYLTNLRRDVQLADEGYLLYGTSYLLRGKLPIRDFRSYDPGRYYWCAPWLYFFGRTFAVQRLAMGLVVLINLTLASGLILSSTQNWLLAGLASTLLFLWMKPYYKAFELLFCLVALLFSGALLAGGTEEISDVVFLYGLLVGLALFFGLNIFLYAGAMMIATWTVRLVCIDGALWKLGDLSNALLGGLAGMLPMFLMLAGKGFAKAYWQRKILPPLRRGASNLPLPRPWLWNKNAYQFDWLGKPRGYFFKTVATTLPLFYLWALYELIVARPAELQGQALFFSASIGGVVYLHHFYSRADVGHLFSPIIPFFLAVLNRILVVCSASTATVLLVGMLSLSIWALGAEFDGTLKRFLYKGTWSAFKTRSETLYVDERTHDFLTKLEPLVEEYSGQDDPVFFAPIQVSLYPLFSRRSAVYDTFCVYPASDQSEDSMIEELAESGTGLAIIFNGPTDQRDDLRFSRTHPRVWRYLHDGYRRIVDRDLPDDVFVFVSSRYDHLKATESKPGRPGAPRRRGDGA